MRTLNGSMAAVLAGVVLLLGVAVAGGCTIGPPYPPEMHVFDEGLIGDWQEDEPHRADSPIVRVEKRPEQTLFGFRSEPQWPGYIVSIRDAKDPAKLFITQRFAVEMLKVGEVELLTLQPMLETEEDLAKFAWSAPIHRVAKVKREGERVKLSFMVNDIVWMPIQPIDPPSAEVVLPVDRGPAKAPWVVSDAKRFIEIVKAAAGRAELWDEPGSLVRIGPAGVPLDPGR